MNLLFDNFGCNNYNWIRVKTEFWSYWNCFGAIWLNSPHWLLWKPWNWKTLISLWSYSQDCDKFLSVRQLCAFTSDGLCWTLAQRLYRSENEYIWTLHGNRHISPFPSIVVMDYLQGPNHSQFTPEKVIYYCRTNGFWPLRKRAQNHGQKTSN